MPVETYQIAGLTVHMDTFGRTLEQAIPYRTDPAAEADVVIKNDWRSFQQTQPHLSDEDCEYLTTGGSFYNQLLKFDGLMVHASAVVVDGQAYLFSGPCGTGKSTHTGLWLQVFGEKARILNDDKPALRQEHGRWYAYGTPWSGKTNQNLNLRVPLAGICFLRQSPENHIEPFSGSPAVFALLEQTVRPRGAEIRLQLLELLDRLLRDVPVWKMDCNMDPEAARISHGAMSKGVRQ